MPGQAPGAEQDLMEELESLGSCRDPIFPGKQRGKSCLERLNPSWSEFQDPPSPLDRSTSPISAASTFPGREKEPLEHLGITGAKIQVGNGAERRTRPRTFLPSG